MFKCLSLFIILVALAKANGHGMLLDPPNRGSLWRFDDDAPINYDDDANYCGGLTEHWENNGGKCGLCGDNYKDPRPRANENTGIYGQGKIVAVFQSGEVVDTYAWLTANHKGYFTFSLCELNNRNVPEIDEECFQHLKFADGSDKHMIFSSDVNVTTHVKLPNNFRCEHCVLRWQYTAGNNWGQCEDGTWEVGCGPQETFRTCSDIEIV